MEEKTQTTRPVTTSKSFMTVGPTLHYSHSNVLGCWLLAIVAFAANCVFWSRIMAGCWACFDPRMLTDPEMWRLGRFVIGGVGIFEYPWQIIVIGLLMGVFAAVPLLAAQLLSFSYSMPFVLMLVFLANLPVFAACVAISCLAVACRPLRFRSRYVALALCMTPQLFYWGYFGGARNIEPIKWGLSYMPWITAWIVALAIAAMVLGIGHYTRYRPGLIWVFTTLVLGAAFAVFHARIGFAELDYQLFVAKNNPEQAVEFQEYGITESLDRIITSPSDRINRYIQNSFYPSEPIALREALKERIIDQLKQGRWPSWFAAGPQLQFGLKRQWLFEQYDLFISRHPRSRRMPVALYYRALLSEYSCDLNLLKHKEIMLFYSNHPFERSQEWWYWLYMEFPDSPESLEARWRISSSLAGQGKFDQALKMLDQSSNMIDDQLEAFDEQSEHATDFLPGLFRTPAQSVMTPFKLGELSRRINHLRLLISEQNRGTSQPSLRRLARFVILNPHDERYTRQLEQMLAETPRRDPLYDNIQLALAKLIADEQLRAEQLDRLYTETGDTDGRMQALYELGLLRISQWRRQGHDDSEKKNMYLSQARQVLVKFLDLYPDSTCAEQVRKNLHDLPEAR